MAKRRVTVVASNGKRESISWYQGTTDVAVIRCACAALGLTVYGSAHLVWESGDIVDFGRPIDDGVTLYLDAVTHEDDATTFTETAVSEGEVAYNRQRVMPAPPPYPPAITSKTAPADYSPPGGSGDFGKNSASSLDAANTMLSSNVKSSQSKEGASRSWRRAFGTANYSVSAEDEERVPLLRSQLVPSQLTHLGNSTFGHESQDSTCLSSASTPDDLHDRVSSREQCLSILKLLRILAHLANERTYLAWVRVAAKLFSAGTLSFALAKTTSGACSMSFVCVGLLSFLLCPYLVVIGLQRFQDAAGVMQGTVYEAYDYFAGRDFKTVNGLMLTLASVTVAVMVVQLLAGY